MHHTLHKPGGTTASEADYAIGSSDVEQSVAGTVWRHLADQLALYRLVPVGYGLGDPMLELTRRGAGIRTCPTGENQHFLV